MVYLPGLFIICQLTKNRTFGRKFSIVQLVQLERFRRKRWKFSDVSALFTFRPKSLENCCTTFQNHIRCGPISRALTEKPLPLPAYRSYRFFLQTVKRA